MEGVCLLFSQARLLSLSPRQLKVIFEHVTEIHGTIALAVGSFKHSSRALLELTATRAPRRGRSNSEESLDLIAAEFAKSPTSCSSASSADTWQSSPLQRHREELEEVSARERLRCT
mmetsp:Transcript_25129/g.59321  ORF Transcript_25129/g.59321 Transcript_25129/m.59321 type:complete len:117 (-) Transcript_25129:120-470(-)